MAEVMEPQRPAIIKKRRASKLEDDDDNKKRGRPRVEKTDQSAADRRRTQIRMAQRAYRQRKESTLEELRRRVNELNGVVDSMETVFQDCMQRLISSGLPDAAVNELRTTASRLATLKASSQAKDLDLSDHDAIIERKSQEPPTSTQTALAPAAEEDVLTPKNVSIWLDQTELSRPSRRPRVDDYLGLGYSIVLPENAEEQSFYSFRPQSTWPSSAPFDIANIMPDMLNPKPPASSKELGAPRTYSFQETTLARRIHRACLEAGYSLVLDPSRNTQTFERVFRLPLLARSHVELATCMKHVLDRGATDTLELYDAPLIHIGGAGTHYPRKDKHGNMQHRKSTFNLGLVGPQTLRLLMQADEQRLAADMAVEFAGFEGEWFDPYDVEGYLVEKGIKIEPTASFVEVQVPASMRTLGDTSSVTSRPATPGLSNTSASDKSASSSDPNTLPWGAFNDSHLDASIYTAMNGAWNNTQTQKEAAAAAGDESSKMIMIDVTKFIRGLVLSAVCLGQTPGFRRKDVDKALANACYDLY